VKNIAAWRKDDSFQLIDFDALPAADIDVPAHYINEQFTEEFQVLYESDAVSGVAGFYYIDANAFANADIILDLSGSFISLPQLNANLFGDVDTKSWSVFGDLTFDLENLLGLSGVELSLGGRYTNDKRTSHVLRRTFLGNTPPFGSNPLLLATSSDFTGSAEFTDFSPKVSLAWSPTGEHNFYASYSQGFKGGGFDPRGQSTVVTADLDGDGDVDADDVFEFFLFDPEEVNSYEIGWKSTLAGGRITSNIAAFYADYTNVQIPGSQAGVDPITDSPTFFGVTTNAGAAEILGIEWEGRALVGEDIFGAGDAFTLSWGAGWIDADYTEFVTGVPPVDVSGQRVVQNTPEYSGAVTTNYSHPMRLAGRGGDIALITQLSYKSRTHIFEIPNPLLDQGGYGLVDASLVWTSDDGRLQIGMHGKNLLDREYRVAGYNFLAQNPDGSLVAPLTPLLGLEGTETAFYGPPRTVTGTIEVQF
jgi:iron complex outermembrane receptor protein